MNSGIYIHIPFCESKCGYCDFYSITNLNYIEHFLKCLREEIEIYSDEIDRKEIFDTIYIGGGTPSILEDEQIESILNILHKKFCIIADAEVTLEMNPGTINQNRLQELLNTGINRLSIGVQSFNESDLKFLGRIHTAEEALNSIKNGRKAGFENISIDLIYALSTQTLLKWKNVLNTAINLNPEHISAYNLTIEKGTPFDDLKRKGELKLLSESQEKEFFNCTDTILKKAGYQHYEISNFALNENYISKHNSKYWIHYNYLGLGPSAHSFWGNKRWSNYKSIEKYITELKKGIKPITFMESLNQKDLEFEHIFLSLRTYRGLEFKKFSKKFNLDFKSKYKSILSKLVKESYVEIDATHIKLTNKGMLLYDEILPSFIED